MLISRSPQLRYPMISQSQKIIRFILLFAFISLCEIRSFATIPLSGLVAAYKFNGNASDSIGTHHGSVSGATLTTDRLGQGNQAYYFNGSTAYIEIPDSDAFSVSTTGNMSISVWVRPDGSGLDANGDLLFSHTEAEGYVHWMGKGGPSQYEWVFRI